jgi:diaminopimelate epimerase
MKIPFTKAHGAKNDFLLTWAKDAPGERLAETARAICDRHTGVGADGWMLVDPAGDHPAIRLFNSDGSEAEISGNGTRCAAAFVLDAGLAAGPGIVIRTGAGDKSLRLLRSTGLWFLFEMNMGRPEVADGELLAVLPLSAGEREATVLWVGNPQCALLVDSFDFDWRALGAEIERHPRFPKRTNVSFVRVVDRHTLDVRFYERGAGETMSSGTGSTGAMAAAVLLGLAESPVRVITPAGPLELRWEADVYLTAPAEIVAAGDFYY